MIADRQGMGRGRGWEALGWLGGGFLGQVREVCRLHLDMDPATKGAEIELRADDVPVTHLLVNYCEGPFVKRQLVGACEGRVTRELIDALTGLVGQAGLGREPQLVYRGARAADELFRWATTQGVWLRHFDDYQRALWDHDRYLQRQTAQLLGDAEYPLDLYLDKRWAPLGEEEPRGDRVAEQVLRLLDTDQPRFVLVLGDFGTGKTFLAHRLAAQLAERGDLVPVLVTMRDLEKGRSLDELLAQHMTANGEDAFSVKALRYLLRRGRVVLLFDGFDELALRMTFRRVPEHFLAHFETLIQAADEDAKVVVTSRHQYFATDSAILKATGARVSRLAGGRIIRLLPLDEGQRRQLAVMAFRGDEPAAQRFLDLLCRIPNLPDLAANPRMLSFMAGWLGEGEHQVTEDELRAAADQSGEMTAGALYRLLLGTWLAYETARNPVLSEEQRLEAVTEVALFGWRTGEPSVTLDDLEAIVGQVHDDPGLRLSEVVQAVGSGTLLVRRGDEEFGFIHQSVMEWLVANHVADRLERHGLDGADEALADRGLTPLMADFLCDLAGADRVIAWARRTVSAARAPGPAAKATAALILQRRGIEVGAVNYAGQDLRGRDFARANLVGASFAGADLAGAVFHRSMLAGANFQGARLTAANLDHAELDGANLREADLTQARLLGANLRGARLDGADLTRARLLGANLRGARLDGANLRRAALVGTTLDPDALRSAASTFGAALPGLPAAPVTSARAPVNTVAVSSDGELIVSGGDDGSVRLWDTATGELARTLEGHSGRVLA
ncbi:MAG: NACHT domain-containing protein, partial [Egibacteraceae bacterium]